MRRLIAILLGVLAAALSVRAEPRQSGPSPDLVSGIDAYNQGNFAAARSLLQRAADRGESEALVNLGYMYARGHGVRSDPAYALQLYRRAASAGDGEGMNAVGFRYNFATPPDLEKAIHWYCLALARGNPRAMNNLAVLFYNGRGVTQDREEARNLWRQAVAHGSLNAQANLAIDQASDTTRSESERREGYAMLRDAALQGSAFAQQVLRRNGDTEAFPPGNVTDLTMKLEPRNVPPGVSYVCEPNVIS
jgi:TPR repeat protein